MLLISEYKLNPEKIKEYNELGYRVTYGYEHPKARKNEGVAILLDTMYKSTIDLIEYLLYTKHKLILKYKDVNYRLQSLDEWKLSYKENGRTFYKKHELLIEYEFKRQDYLDSLAKKKNEIKAKEMVDKYNIDKLPSDLDLYVDTFSRLYNINVDMSSDIDKIICYNQIKNYIDLDISYQSDDVSCAYTLEGQQLMYSNCIDIEEQDIFPVSAFKNVEYQEHIDIDTYGDETYLEDTIYKES